MMMQCPTKCLCLKVNQRNKNEGMNQPIYTYLYYMALLTNI